MTRSYIKPTDFTYVYSSSPIDHFDHCVSLHQKWVEVVEQYPDAPRLSAGRPIDSTLNILHFLHAQEHEDEFSYNFCAGHLIDYFSVAYSAFCNAGRYALDWEGDVRTFKETGFIVNPCFVSPTYLAGFKFKQDNNGTSFICSNFPVDDRCVSLTMHKGASIK